MSIMGLKQNHEMHAPPLVPECKPCVLFHGGAALTNHDVTAAIELAIDVHLWKGGPLAVLLHAASEPLILEDVDRLVWHVEGVEDLHARVGEATLQSSRSRKCLHCPHCTCDPKRGELQQSPHWWALLTDLRELPRAFHKEHHFVAADELVQRFLELRRQPKIRWGCHGICMETYGYHRYSSKVHLHSIDNLKREIRCTVWSC